MKWLDICSCPVNPDVITLSQMELPTFRYHPNPVASGAVEPERARCECCERMVDHIYVASTYSTHDIDKLCPWCIADGTAHEKFDAEFADPYPLRDAGIDESIIAEVTTRTPGFISWQQEIWLSHCNNACVFVGDATVDVVGKMTNDEIDYLLQDHGVSREQFKEMAANYQPGGQPAIYHFKCLECDSNLFGMDYT